MVGTFVVNFIFLFISKKKNINKKCEREDGKSKRKVCQTEEAINVKKWLNKIYIKLKWLLSRGEWEPRHNYHSLKENNYSNNNR